MPKTAWKNWHDVSNTHDVLCSECTISPEQKLLGPPLQNQSPHESCRATCPATVFGAMAWCCFAVSRGASASRNRCLMRIVSSSFKISWSKLDVDLHDMTLDKTRKVTWRLNNFDWSSSLVIYSPAHIWITSPFSNVYTSGWLTGSFGSPFVITGSSKTGMSCKGNLAVYCKNLLDSHDNDGVQQPQTFKINMMASKCPARSRSRYFHFLQVHPPDLSVELDKGPAKDQKKIKNDCSPVVCTLCQETDCNDKTKNFMLKS